MCNTKFVVQLCHTFFFLAKFMGRLLFNQQLIPCDGELD